MRKVAAVSLLAIALMLSIAPILFSVAPVAYGTTGRVCSAAVASAPSLVSFGSGQTKILTYTFGTFVNFVSGDVLTVTPSAASGGWSWSVTSGSPVTWTGQSSISVDLTVTAPSTVSTTSVILSLSNNNCGIAGAAGTTLSSASTTLTAPEFGSSIGLVLAIGIVALALFRRNNVKQTNTTTTPV